MTLDRYWKQVKGMVHGDWGRDEDAHPDSQAELSDMIQGGPTSVDQYAEDMPAWRIVGQPPGPGMRSVAAHDPARM